MGNTQTQQNLGDFQQGAGQATATLGLVSSYIGAFILICFAVGCIYIAFVPMSINDLGSQHICSSDKDCMNNETCQNYKCSPPPEPERKHPWYLLGAVIFIALAIFVVWYARTVKNIADSSRGGAQFVGAMGEAQLVRDIFRFKTK
jgi:hypothetical protein